MSSQKIAIGLVAVALFAGVVTTHADDISAGFKAYQRGDYATALRIFRQFADQGDADAQLNLGVMYIGFVSACASWSYDWPREEVALEEYKGFDRDDTV